MEDPIFEAEGVNAQFVVDGKPDVVLWMVRGFLDSDEWPYPVGARSFLGNIVNLFPRRGAFDLYGPGNVLTGGNKVSDVRAPQRLWDSPSGLLVLLVLSLITASLFLWVYGLWTLLFRPAVEARVDVTATPIGMDKTKVTVEGITPEHTEPVETWIRRELVENRAGAGIEASPNFTPFGNGILAQVKEKLATQQPPPESTIPDQIRKLAELRDDGAITNEEFEAKKRSLLDRM